MLISSIQFTVSIVIGFLYIQLSPHFSLAHAWLTGLEFSIPPEDKVLNKLDEDSQAKGKFKKKGFFSSSTKKNEIKLKVASIEDGTLLKHIFWEEYDQLVLLLLCIALNYVIAEFWSCFSDEKNTILTWTLVISSILCLKTMIAVIIKLGLQSYELKLTICVGVLSFICALTALQLPEFLLEFSSDLRGGFEELMHNLKEWLLQNDVNMRFEISYGTFKWCLALTASVISSIIFFPGFRLGRSHHEICKYTPQPYHPFISGVSLWLPVFVLILWLQPVSNFLQRYISHALYELIRFYLLLLISITKLYLLRPYMQSFLATAVGWAELLLSDTQSKDRGKNIKYKILGIYSYLCVAAVQILAPSFLLLAFALLLKSRGLPELSLFPYCSQLYNLSNNNNHVEHLFTEKFFRGFFSFLSWWLSLSWFFISTFALLYERNQSIFARKD